MKSDTNWFHDVTNCCQGVGVLGGDVVVGGVPDGVTVPFLFMVRLPVGVV